MENLKYILSSLLVIVILGLGGYWAFTTIESGSSHVDSQKFKESENKNKELEKEVANLKKEISLLQADKEEILAAQGQAKSEEEAVKSSTTTTPSTPTTTKPVVLKNQTLINELQKLADNKVYLKLKSQGPAVGSVQKFLNLYNKTSNRIDNDYGTSTVTAVKNYQKAVGITADGETGPSTYLKMITWLKNH